MGREICKFKTGSKKVLPADSAAALSPSDPSHYQHRRPLDIQLTLPGRWIEGLPSKWFSSLTNFAATNSAWAIPDIDSYVNAQIIRSYVGLSDATNLRLRCHNGCCCCCSPEYA